MECHAVGSRWLGGGGNVNQYYASELDKYAIKVTQANWTETIQVGCVIFVRRVLCWKASTILKALSSIYLSEKTKTQIRCALPVRRNAATIDLLIGGSPCQGFSFAGKQLAFNDPRSRLFFEFVKIRNQLLKLNPSLKFMLENVKMKKEYLAIISEQLGVEPVFINSALVTAQNRQRYYWFNWHVEQPEDRGILLADILECEVSDDYNSSTPPDHIGGNQLNPRYKSQANTIHNPAAVVGRKLDENGKRNDKLASKPVQCLEVHEHGKSRCLSTVSKDTVVSSLPAGRYPIGGGQNDRPRDYIRSHIASPNHKARIENSQDVKKSFTAIDPEKAVCMTARQYANWKGNYCSIANTYRKLTPIECERLQTVPDNYTNHVSNTQRYRMLGNGWTVDVIAHILKPLIFQRKDLAKTA